MEGRSPRNGGCLIPTSVDYRLSLGEVRDQGRHPTCAAHAVSTAHEHARADRRALSAEYLYHFASNGGAYQGITFPEAGAALENIGQPTAAACGVPDVSRLARWVPPPGLELFRRKSEGAVATPDNIADVLRSGRLPVLGFTLPNSFLSPAAPWVIKSDGTRVARHAVVVVSLSISRGSRLFGIRNSWGEGWADHGHAWIGDDFLLEHLEELLIIGEEPNGNG